MRLSATCHSLEIADPRFVNLPERKRTQWALTREEMKNCVWLKPELFAQIEFYRMDARWTSTAFKVCRPERRQRAVESGARVIEKR